jgi:hypothetical protein
MSDRDPVPQRQGYEPGRLAKLSVVVSACAYFAYLYFGAMRGADLAQGAFLQLLVPFILAVPAWVVAHIAWFLGGRRQRIGDVGFTITMVAECAAIAVAAYLH